MKRFAATFLATLFLAVPALYGTAAQAQPEPARLRVDIATFSPRVLTSSATELAVTGTVTNVGDRRINRPQVRLELGERQASDRQLSDVLAGGVFKSTPLSTFTTLTEALEPGQSAPLSITVPLAGRGLLSQPGVYSALVNVNGTPDFSGPARLGAVSLLLPVLGKQSSSHSGPTVTLLWPITSVPHVYTAAYGGALTLADDQLATELGPDGRLTALVSSAKTAIQNDSRLGTAMCFALDPDLLATVAAMSNGYQVHTDSGTVAGTGAAAAKTWLASLRSLVSDRCTIAMPFADAELNALTAVRAGDATDTALLNDAVSGTNTIAQILDVTPQSGVLWPADTPNDAALAALPKAGVQTVLTDGGRLQSAEGAGGGVTVQGSAVRAQPTDSLIASAFAGLPMAPNSVTMPASTQPAIAAQNGLGAIAYRAGLGQAGEDRPAHLLVAPPRRWTVPTGELTSYLESMRQFLNTGLVSAAGLPSLLSAEAGSGSVDSGAQDVTANVDPAVTAALSRIDDQAAGLSSAMAPDPTKRVKPEDVVAPVRNALLRGASSAWAGGPVTSATANAQAELTAITAQVNVEQPKQTIALASGASPLPVFVTNNLPVVIKARIILNNNTGLRPEDPQDILFPAMGGKNQLIPVEALRAGRFSVDVSLSTPAGTPLGSATRFELTSTEYGAITLIVTITAAGALLLLSSRRIYRRIKEGRVKEGTAARP